MTGLDAASHQSAILRRTVVSRVLDTAPVRSLDDYLSAGGGAGLRTAHSLQAEDLIDRIAASGLRGRGGAGFPTGRKWRTVLRNSAREGGPDTTVVVNAAEGEPGSYKDRMLLLQNPYRVVEGGLIAARAVGARAVVVGLKDTEDEIRARVDAAIGEIRGAGWADGLDVLTVAGPPRYLLGEETGLLEAVAGRLPLPRVPPPYREGLAETSGAADEHLAGPSSAAVGTPALVNNVETLAHVAGILANGDGWFGEFGTAESPGTFVCTLSGSITHEAVVEIPLGTRLMDLLEAIGGGPRVGRRFVGMLSGASHGILPVANFDTDLTHEAMRDVGSGLGSGSFILLDDSDDIVSVVAGISRFLAVESCGQCQPCKQDGLEIAAILGRLSEGTPRAQDLVELDDRLRTVPDGARCNLASQQRDVVQSLLERFPETVMGKVTGEIPGRAPADMASIHTVDDGHFVLDDAQQDQSPEWVAEVEIGTQDGA